MVSSRAIQDVGQRYKTLLDIPGHIYAISNYEPFNISQITVVEIFYTNPIFCDMCRIFSLIDLYAHIVNSARST